MKTVLESVYRKTKVRNGEMVIIVGIRFMRQKRDCREVNLWWDLITFSILFFSKRMCNVYSICYFILFFFNELYTFAIKINEWCNYKMKLTLWYYIWYYILENLRIISSNDDFRFAFISYKIFKNIDMDILEYEYYET